MVLKKNLLSVPGWYMKYKTFFEFLFLSRNIKNFGYY